MSDNSKIEWCDASWNCVRGCSRVSLGCTSCYAERVAARFSGAGLPYEGLARRTASGEARWTGEVRLVPERLEDPLRWKRPRRIFVNSMSDLFHEKLSDADIDRVFAVMLLAPHHTFQVLTKRAGRMREYMTMPGLYQRVLAAAGELRAKRPGLDRIAISSPTYFPARWIWLGVSVENQATANERIPHLLETPAAVRFLSCEPLLGPIDLDLWLRCPHCGYTQRDQDINVDHYLCARDHNGARVPDGLHWVIGGGESGNGARPPHPFWFRSLRDQCESAGVPYFHKQNGEWWHGPKLPPGMLGNDIRGVINLMPDGSELGDGLVYPRDVACMLRVGKKAAGRLLDGVEQNAFPEVQNG